MRPFPSPRPSRAVPLAVAMTMLATATCAFTTLSAPAAFAEGCAPTWHALPTPAGTPAADSSSVDSLGAGSARIMVSPLDLVSAHTALVATGRQVRSAPDEPVVPEIETNATSSSANFSSGSVSSFDSAQDGWVLGAIPFDAAEGENPVLDHWSHGRWTFEPVAPTLDFVHRPAMTINAIAAVSPTDAWAVGDYHAPGQPVASAGVLIEHWDGLTWSIVPAPLSQSVGVQLIGLTALSATNIWAVGAARSDATHLVPILQHWDGRSWQPIKVPAGAGESYLAAVSAVSPTDVWAAGAQTATDGSGAAIALVEHFNGSQWSVVKHTPRANAILNSIYAAGPTDVWSTQEQSATDTSGQPQTFLHWDGSAWHEVATPDPLEYGMSYEYTSIAGSGPKDIWATGIASSSQSGIPSLVIAHLTC